MLSAISGSICSEAVLIFGRITISIFFWNCSSKKVGCLFSLLVLPEKCFHPLDLWRPILNDPQPHVLSPTNYGTTTAPCMWTNQIKTKTKSHVTFKLTTLYCLKPESIGKFLVNNVFMFDSV